jgi:hypothetical protein
MFEGDLKSADVTYRKDGWPSLAELTPHPRPALPPYTASEDRVETLLIGISLACTDKQFWTYGNNETTRRKINIDLDIENVRERFHEDISLRVDAETWINLVAQSPNVFA